MSQLKIQKQLGEEPENASLVDTGSLVFSLVVLEWIDCIRKWIANLIDVFVSLVFYRRHETRDRARTARE